MANVGVGTGSWESGAVRSFHNNGHEVALWSRFQKEVDTLNTNKRALSKLRGFNPAKQIVIRLRLESCDGDGTDLLVLAVPSPYVKGNSNENGSFCSRGADSCNVAKGIEETTLMTRQIPSAKRSRQAGVSVLSGPSHAEEVGRETSDNVCDQRTEDEKTAEYLQVDFYDSHVFRVYTTPDTLGVELGGSLKNVIALAAGTADGLRLW